MIASQRAAMVKATSLRPKASESGQEATVESHARPLARLTSARLRGHAKPRRLASGASSRRTARARTSALFLAGLATMVLTGGTSWSGEPSEAITACMNAYESAQELRKHDDLLGARKMLQTCTATACPEMIQTDCTTWMTEVNEAMPSIIFGASVGSQSVHDVAVSMDGARLVPQIDARPLEVNPGIHTFVFTRDGQDPVEKKAMIMPRLHDQMVSVRWKGAPVVRSRPVPPSFYILSGASVAALATFTGFGVSGDALQHTLQTSCSPLCSQSQISTLHTRFLVADIALGVGAASAVGAIVALLTRPERPVPRDRAAMTTSAPGRTWSIDMRALHGGAAVDWSRSF